MEVQVTKADGAQRFYKCGINGRMMQEGNMTVANGKTVEVEVTSDSNFLKLVGKAQPTYIKKSDTDYASRIKANAKPLAAAV